MRETGWSLSVAGDDTWGESTLVNDKLLLRGVIRDDNAANNGGGFDLQKLFGPEVFDKTDQS